MIKKGRLSHDRRVAVTYAQTRAGAPIDQVEHINVSFAFIAIRDYWLTVLCVAAAVFFCGLVYATILPPLYVANVLIKVDLPEDSRTVVPQALSGLIEPRNATSAEIELLRSRAVLAATVEKLNLTAVASPRYFPIIGAAISRSRRSLSAPTLFGLGRYAWGAESILVEDFQVPDSLKRATFTLTVDGLGSYTVTGPNAFQMHGKLHSFHRIDTPLGPISIQVAELNAHVGVQFTLQKLFTTDAIEDLQKRLNIEEHVKDSGLISVSLQGPDSKRAATILNELATQYLHENVSLRSNKADKQLAFLENQLPHLKASAEAAEASYTHFRNESGAIDLTEEVRSALQKSTQLEVQLSELRQRRDELRTRLGEANPVLVSVRSQIGTVEKELQSTDAELRRVPATEQEVARLTRDVSVSSELYKSVLSSIEQLKLLQASELDSAILVDAAVPSDTSAGPKKGLLVVVSLGAGLLCGGIAAVVRKALKGTIDTQQDLLARFGVPVEAVIPHTEQANWVVSKPSTQVRSIPLLAAAVEVEGAIESLRGLRSSYQLSSLGSKNKVIAIVGPTPGVGKSFIAANLSAVLSSAGHRILLVDGDLKGGCLHRYFGVASSPGLSNLLTTNLDARAVTHTEVQRNLDFIATGRRTIALSDALVRAPLATMFDRLSSEYDFVIVDTAPALVVSDALIIAKYAARIFCVTRRGQTTSEQIDETLKRFRRSGSPITSFIFNDARPSYASYGYRYSYGSLEPSEIVNGHHTDGDR